MRKICRNLQHHRWRWQRNGQTFRSWWQNNIKTIFMTFMDSLDLYVYTYLWMTHRNSWKVEYRHLIHFTHTHWKVKDAKNIQTNIQKWSWFHGHEPVNQMEPICALRLRQTKGLPQLRTKPSLFKEIIKKKKYSVAKAIQPSRPKPWSRLKS